MPASVRAIAVGVLLGLPPAAPAGGVDYGRDVLPILSAHCFACHGPDASSRKADLRLDGPADPDGPDAIAPGRPADSELLKRVASAGADRMPPPKAGPALTPAQVETLHKWVEGGAGYAGHWAYTPPRRPAVPTVDASRTEVRNPIDAFAARHREQLGLPHSGPAGRETLIRRATLDLTGLPPTPEEVDRFVADPAPDAWERLIDRLLASPHYGERWGRHWLDVARYADSGGFETDIFFAHAHRYRDYVIRALNADKPFDRFVREQVAGDVLFPDDPDARAATGLFTIGPVLQEAAMVPGRLDHEWLTDAADTTGAAFLGLTVGCARCHDHKYDPVSQKDYYALQAVFAGSSQADVQADGKARPVVGKAMVKTTLTLYERARAGGPAVPARVLAARDAPLEVRLLRRGELDAPGDPVPPGLPAALGGGRRLDGLPPARWRAELAGWLASADNPLTARVVVNRVWQGHFGEGLVRTPNDFGVRGDRPTHPELLDWLAADFVEGGWSLKRLHRTVMTSATYRMGSDLDPAAWARDPENRGLTRFQPRRVEAEVIWDAVRAVAGTLDRRLYGLPVAPPLDGQEQVGNFRKWPTSPPDEANRRAVYLLARRSFRFPLLAAFDLPDGAGSCGRRDATTVPTQALALLNNRTMREQAEAFAGRLRREAGGDPAAVAALAWRYAYGRAITPAEAARAVEFLRTRSAGELALALFNTNEFLYLP